MIFIYLTCPTILPLHPPVESIFTIEGVLFRALEKSQDSRVLCTVKDKDEADTRISFRTPFTCAQSNHQVATHRRRSFVRFVNCGCFTERVNNLSASTIPFYTHTQKHKESPEQIPYLRHVPLVCFLMID